MWLQKEKQKKSDEALHIRDSLRSKLLGPSFKKQNKKDTEVTHVVAPHQSTSVLPSWQHQKKMIRFQQKTS